MALLALLACTRHHVLARDKLIGLLWPETDTTSARGLLSASVHAVRKALGDEVLVSEGEALRLDVSRIRIDALELEAAFAAGDYERAVASRTGPFLDGFSIPDSAEFDQWMDSERVRLEGLYDASLERLAEVAEAAGDAAAAAAWWRRRLSCTPADARTIVRLMEVLAQLGDRAAALQAASAHSALLMQEFGAQPDPAVEALSERLRLAETPLANWRPAAGEDSLSNAVAKPPSPPIEDNSDRPKDGISESPRHLATGGVEPGERPGHGRIGRRGLIAVGLVVFAGAVGWRTTAPVRANSAVREAARLVDAGRYAPAFRLLRKAQAVLPQDARIHELLMEATFVASITTDPPGATVSVRDYFEPDNWLLLGPSPISDVRLPASIMAWRISHQGYETLEQLTGPRRQLMHFSLSEATESAPDMARIAGRSYALFNLAAVDLNDFWLDRHEVTNRQYEDFLHSPAYGDSAHWRELLDQYARTASLADARRSLRDSTGDEGPATWQHGRYPDGQGDHPVGGVSWYEAAAYCAAQGKRLPTIYHWYVAAQPGLLQYVAQFSNFGSDGTVEIGAPLSLGGSGLYDLGGNVKEWTWNATHGGRRFIAGGSWRDGFEAFFEPDAQPASLRDPDFGFRCARYDEPATSAATAFLDRTPRGIQAWSPAEGEVLRSYLAQFEIDHGPLAPDHEWTDDRSEGWRLERWSVNAAYGGERLPILIYLPENGTPPFQTVVYFPGAGAFDDAYPVGDGAEAQRNYFLFLVRAGRAVVVPTYRGTWERHRRSVRSPESWRDFVVYASKDLQRAVDYLETRDDIDSQRLAYYGLSAGAALGPIMLATEPRLKLAVLAGGGLVPFATLPEVDQIHYVGQVRQPTLLINGKYDFFYSYESGRMLIDNLATPPEHRKHLLLESGHLATQNWHEYAREILVWLDLYFGRAQLQR